MSDLSGITWDDAPQQMGPPAALAGPAPAAQGITWDDQPAAQAPGILYQLAADVKDVPHQLGLTGRYALEGAGNLAGVVSDPIGQFLPGYEKTGAAASRLADAVGLPKPQGSLENTVGAASRALVGTGLTAGLGGAAGAAELAAQPGMQALSSMLGGGVTEATDNPYLGAAASLLPGAKALGLMGARGLARGADPSQMQDTIKAFEAAGTTPSVGQATQGGLAQGLESLLAKLPGSAGVMARKAQGQGAEMGAKMGQFADKLAPGSDPTQAGMAIEKGITGEGGFVDRFKQQAKTLYDAVDQHMPGDTAVPMPATQDLLAKLTTPIKGAEATSGVLANPKLDQIAKAIGSDTQNSQLAGLGNQALPPGSVTFGPNGAPQLGQGGTMPYQAIKSLRTKVGDMIADAGIVSDVPRGALKQLYGALSTDMRTATNAAGPEAATANNMAENFYRQGMDHIDQIESVVGRAGGPEKVFNAAMSGTRDGATTLNSVMSALKPDQQNVVASAVVRRMGMANPGAQDAGGEVFSTNSFLTNWNKLSPQAKQVLFKNDSDIRDNLDQIAHVTSNIKEGSKVFQNSSGTAPAGALIGLGTAALGAMAHPVAAVPILASLGTTNLSARLMTNPTFVKWLARNTTAPVGVIPAQIGYLSQLGQKSGDRDLTDAAQQLNTTLGQTTQ